MRIIATKRLAYYALLHPSMEPELTAWIVEVRHAVWRTPMDVKNKYARASILKSGRVVCNINGNRHRLVVWINYQLGIVYIKFIGTHEAYDTIDAGSI